MATDKRNEDTVLHFPFEGQELSEHQSEDGRGSFEESAETANGNENDTGANAQLEREAGNEKGTAAEHSDNCADDDNKSATDNLEKDVAGNVLNAMEDHDAEEQRSSEVFSRLMTDGEFDGTDGHDDIQEIASEDEFELLDLETVCKSRKVDWLTCGAFDDEDFTDA